MWFYTLLCVQHVCFPVIVVITVALAGNFDRSINWAGFRVHYLWCCNILCIIVQRRRDILLLYRARYHYFCFDNISITLSCPLNSLEFEIERTECFNLNF